MPERVDMVELVKDFHRKYGGEYLGAPRNLEAKEHGFRIGCMLEELCEYQTARNKEDLEMQLDSLVDAVYFVIGTAVRQGFDFDEAFLRVHLANMRKIKAKTPEMSKRGSCLDVVKPEGWVPPDLSDLVK